MKIVCGCEVVLNSPDNSLGGWRWHPCDDHAKVLDGQELLVVVPEMNESVLETLVCPTCGARRMQPCATKSGRDHVARVRAWIAGVNAKIEKNITDARTGEPRG